MVSHLLTSLLKHIREQAMITVYPHLKTLHSMLFRSGRVASVMVSSLLTAGVVGTAIPAQAFELRPLADCTTAVFREITQNHSWSGKRLQGCLAELYVEKRPEGVVVTAWRNTPVENGWERVAFSTAMGYFEVADRKTSEIAAHDIKTRAARLERCLASIITVNDPLECRDRATKSYVSGADIGTEEHRTVWLDDDGRYSIVEYAFGTTSAAANPPANLFDGQELQPGARFE
jgi:hypothetical protein